MAKHALKYDVGLVWTLGVPADQTPMAPLRRVVSTRLTLKEAFADLRIIINVATVLQSTVNAQAYINGANYVPLPAIGWFIEPIEIPARLSRVSLTLRSRTIVPGKRHPRTKRRLVGSRTVADMQPWTRTVQ